MSNNLPVPFVSVILPVRNEAAYIRRSLASVLAQDYPIGQMEILVVDGMSIDGTREIVKKMMSKQEKYSVKLIDNKKLITPAALNCGFNHSKGNILIRVDGHCEIAPDYVRRCVSYLQREEIDGVGGVIETKGSTYTARAIAIAMSSVFGVGNSSFRIGNHKQFLANTIPFPAYKRDIISRVGAYDEDMLCNEDDEYNYRLRKIGGRILLAGDITSRYYCRGSLVLLMKQYLKYGIWKIRVLQKHPRQMSLCQFVPSAFVSALGISLILACFPLSRFLSPVVPALYLIANLLASVYTASSRGWKYLPLLPVIFAILHLSYGLGFLVGLIKFANRWGRKRSQAPAFVSQDARTS